MEFKEQMIWRFFKLPQTISRIIKRILYFQPFLYVKCGKGDTEYCFEFGSYSDSYSCDKSSLYWKPTLGYCVWMIYY